MKSQRVASAVANAALVLLPFLVLEGAFRLLPVSDPPAVLPVSAGQPVARLQPNVEYLYSRDWNFSVTAPKRSNNFGYIHRADYRPEQKSPLMLVIGDSFVEANVVRIGRSAAELLHERVAGRGRVYSIGLSGAPLSQYLVFADYARATFRPSAMAFCIIGNDFDESLLKYKSDHRFHYFEERGGRLELRRVDYRLSPAKKLLRESAFLRYVMLNLSAGARIDELLQRLRGADLGSRYSGAVLEQRVVDSQRAVERFFELLPAASGLGPDAIVFVLDAVRPALYSPETRRQAEDGYHSRMRRYFAREAAARGYEVIDMAPAFLAWHARDGARFEAAPTDSHWNELGHRVVAGEVEKSRVFERAFGSDKLIQVRAQ